LQNLAFDTQKMFLTNLESLKPASPLVSPLRGVSGSRRAAPNRGFSPATWLDVPGWLWAHHQHGEKQPDAAAHPPLTVGSRASFL